MGSGLPDRLLDGGAGVVLLGTLAATGGLISGECGAAAVFLSAALLGVATGTKAGAPATPGVVTLTATDSAYGAPDTLPEGWTTFRLLNQGTHPHAAQLARHEEGRLLEEFVTAYVAAYEYAWRTVGPRPSWGRRVGGPGLAEPHGTTNATMYLEPGSYWWYCPMWKDGVPHVLRKTGMEHPFVVVASGAGGSQAAPEPTAEIQLDDYTFRVSAPLTAGRHVFRVEVALGKLGPGRTIEYVLAWLQDPESPPPAFGSVGGVNALAPGAEALLGEALESADARA